MLRRAFGTIHEGHCPNGWDVYNLFTWMKTQLDWPDRGYHAGAFALEETESGNLHIQFYFECTRKRISTMANDWCVSTPSVFDVVRDPTGSWDYTTGSGRYEDKPALDRFQWGSPSLYGGTAKADLKMLVDLVINGNTLPEIMTMHPYAYCVHRSRLVAFYDDWRFEGPKDLITVEKA